MQTTLLKENLIKPLLFVTRNASTKTQLPIAQCVLLDAKDGQVTLATTNLETTVYTRVSAKVEKEGGVCVPVKVFSEYIQSLPDGKITLTTKKENLTVESGGYEAVIPGFSKEEFPHVSRKMKESAEIKGDEFLEAVKLVAFAAASDEGRPLLMGIKIKKTKDGCVLAATDGYRLSVKNSDTFLPEKTDTVLPGRALLEAVRIKEEEKGSLFLNTMEDGHIAFFIGETEIYTRSLEGEYPNFERIIPKTTTTSAVVKKDVFFRAMKSAAIFARDSANIVRLQIKEGVIVVTANTPQVGENKIDIEAKTTGDEGNIAFNSRFLLEFLTNAPGEDVLLETTGSLNPGAFKTPGDDSYLHIIMPVRVQG